MKKTNTVIYNKQRNYRLSPVIPLLCCCVILLSGCSDEPEWTLGDGVECSFSDADEWTLGDGVECSFSGADADADTNSDTDTSADVEANINAGDNVNTLAARDRTGDLYSDRDSLAGKVDGALQAVDSAGNENCVGNKSNVASENNITEPLCYVFVCGAVVNPGVYELPGNMHIIDAVGAAGGFAENANNNYINLALKVADGMRIYVPNIGENIDELTKSGLIGTDISSNGGNSRDIVRSGTTASETAVESTNLAGVGTSTNETLTAVVNINTANETELMTLPGIGKSKAGKIIAFREKNGAFRQISDIMKVDGIKNGMYDKIKEYITVE